MKSVRAVLLGGVSGDTEQSVAPGMSKRSSLVVRGALRVHRLEFCLVAYSIVTESASSSWKMVRK